MIIFYFIRAAIRDLVSKSETRELPELLKIDDGRFFSEELYAEHESACFPSLLCQVGFLFMPNVMLTGRWKPPTADTAKSVCEQLAANCRDLSLLRQLLDQVEITMT